MGKYKNKKYNSIAVLGSGVMGSQIAAVFANANIRVYLFDKDNYAKKNIAKLSTISPLPLVSEQKKSYIIACNYKQHLANISKCDLIIEAIVEDLVIKKELFATIDDYLKDDVVIASNTSSLSINTLATSFNKHSHRFCGIHFFNPPRYMSLVELIKPQKCDDFMLDLEVFLTTELGKNILYAKDSAGFIANRIGVFSLASVIYRAKEFNLSFDTVDALTGKLINRSKSASFRTADLVGLDVLLRVFNEFYNKHTIDPWRDYFIAPNWLIKLVENKQLGQKTSAGIYKKQNKDILAYNIANESYEKTSYKIDKSVKNLLKTTPISQQIQALSTNQHPQAQFLYAIIKDLCLYASYHLNDIATTPLDIDTALRWGYGWQLGIFAYWQQNNINDTLELLAQNEQKQKEHKYIADWLQWCPEFYNKDKTWHPKTRLLVNISKAKVYKRQLYRSYFLNQCEDEEFGHTIFANDCLRLWHDGDGIAIISFKTKMHTLNYELIISLNKAIDIASSDFEALIIWQQQAPFCAGADLYEIYAGAKLGRTYKTGVISDIKGALLQTVKPQLPKITKLPSISDTISLLQQTLSKLKFCEIPTIAAVEGLALGGGCELLLHCDRRVVASESYIGLVEIGVGVLPAGGGCKEMAYRAYKNNTDGDLFALIAKYFEQIGLASVSNSGENAKQMHYLDSNDIIVPHTKELLYFAKQQAQIMIDNCYRPPDKNTLIKLAGSGVYANLLAQLTNMNIGNYISQHDYHIATYIAKILTGGENMVENTEVGENYLLNLEKKYFLSLLEEPKTQDRIEHMLKTKKPLRN